MRRRPSRTDSCPSIRGPVWVVTASRSTLTTLAWKARQHDFHVQFIELAAGINDSMPYFVCDRVSAVLNEHGKCLKGSRILVLGVTYKRDVADLRESPALRIIELLHAKGAEMTYNDPLI